jgi:FtsZ-interacting cell division protein ZipA
MTCDMAAAPPVDIPQSTHRTIAMKRNLIVAAFALIGFSACSPDVAPPKSANDQSPSAAASEAVQPAPDAPAAPGGTSEATQPAADAQAPAQRDTSTAAPTQADTSTAAPAAQDTKPDEPAASGAEPKKGEGK